MEEGEDDDDDGDDGADKNSKHTMRLVAGFSLKIHNRFFVAAKEKVSQPTVFSLFVYKHCFVAGKEEVSTSLHAIFSKKVYNLSCPETENNMAKALPAELCHSGILHIAVENVSTTSFVLAKFLMMHSLECCDISFALPFCLNMLFLECGFQDAKGSSSKVSLVRRDLVFVFFKGFILIDDSWKRNRALMPLKSCKIFKNLLDMFHAVTCFSCDKIDSEFSKFTSMCTVCSVINKTSLYAKQFDDVIEAVKLFHVHEVLEKDVFVLFLEEDVLKDSLLLSKTTPVSICYGDRSYDNVARLRRNSGELTGILSSKDKEMDKVQRKQCSSDCFSLVQRLEDNACVFSHGPTVHAWCMPCVLYTTYGHLGAAENFLFWLNTFEVRRKERGDSMDNSQGPADIDFQGFTRSWGSKVGQRPADLPLRSMNGNVVFAPRIKNFTKVSKEDILDVDYAPFWSRDLGLKCTLPCTHVSHQQQRTSTTFLQSTKDECPFSVMADKGGLRQCSHVIHSPRPSSLEDGFIFERKGREKLSCMLTKAVNFIGPCEGPLVKQKEFAMERKSEPPGNCLCKVGPSDNKVLFFSRQRESCPLCSFFSKQGIGVSFCSQCWERVLLDMVKHGTQFPFVMLLLCTCKDRRFLHWSNGFVAFFQMPFRRDFVASYKSHASM